MDRRVIKTKRAIKKAFFALLAEKDLNDISVTDISRIAEINRKTFYNYYTGVFQLVDELENEILSKLDATLKEIDIIESIKEPQKLFALFDETIGINDPFLRTMLEADKVSGFFSKFENEIICLIRDEVSKQAHTDPAATEYIIHFILAGEISVYKAWLRSDRSFPADKLSGMIHEMALDGIRSLVRKNIPDM